MAKEQAINTVDDVIDNHYFVTKDEALAFLNNMSGYDPSYNEDIFGQLRTNLEHHGEMCWVVTVIVSRDYGLEDLIKISPKL